MQRVVKAFAVPCFLCVLHLLLTWSSHEVTSRFTFFTARWISIAYSQKGNEKVVPFKRSSVLKSQTEKRQQGTSPALRVLIAQTQEIADQSDAKNWPPKNIFLVSLAFSPVMPKLLRLTLKLGSNPSDKHDFYSRKHGKIPTTVEPMTQRPRSTNVTGRSRKLQQKGPQSIVSSDDCPTARCMHFCQGFCKFNVRLSDNV